MTKAKGGLAAGAGTGSADWTQTYSYDRFGNRTNVAATGTAADSSAISLDGLPNLGYDNNSNRITTTGFEYDVAGNQIKAPDASGYGMLFEYDAANRITLIRKESDGSSIQAFNYGSTNARLVDRDYGANLLKIYATTGGTTLAKYTEFTHTIPTWTNSFTYLGARLLSTIAPNGTGGEFTEYNHPDRLGTRLITNGTNSYEQVTLPFGTALNAETTGSISRNFTSYERSIATGLDYAINRTYDSKQGRFTQIDPIGMNAVDLNMPQTLNLYSYCANDPINRTDPTGLSWFSNLFRIFRTILNIISNIIRIAVTVVVIISLFTNPIGWLATIGVVISLAAAAIVPNLIGIVAKTIWRNIKASIREDGLSFGSFFRGLWRGLKQSFSFIKAAFSRALKDLLAPVYGYFCAPGWGIDGPTISQEPIDELDSACKEHDFKMREIDDLFEAGQISKKERDRLKTKADLKFMRKAIASRNRASGGFQLILQIGFLVRILSR